jgi:hypothetical protein
MILLIGMKISFTKKPMKPMMKNPTDVACAILENSAGGQAGGGDARAVKPRRTCSALQHSARSRRGGADHRERPSQTERASVAVQRTESGAPFLSGFVHRFTSRQLSLIKSTAGFFT